MNCTYWYIKGNSIHGAKQEFKVECQFAKIDWHLNCPLIFVKSVECCGKKRGGNVKKLFLIKRKGFNYYTDYTELYLHKSFENKGYKLVKDESKCLFDVIIDISEEKYMTALSPYFDALPEEDVKELAEILSSNFKSEVIVMPCLENYQFKGIPHKFMFSDIYNAFEEDVYVYNESPEFARECFSQCKGNQPYVVEYVNYGGAFTGLDITLSFDNANIVLEEASLNYYKGNNKISKELTFEKSGDMFKCSVPEFYMNRGINKYSAVLRGKKREDEKSKNGFYIRFVPRGSDEILNAEIMVKPL